jgi:hypothetical protein
MAIMGLSLGMAAPAAAQAPRANGETILIHHFKGSVGNMHAFVAARKGFCEKYNFHCELVSIPSALTAVQAVVGGSLDIAQGGIEMTASAINAGSDLVIAGVSLPRAVLFVAARCRTRPRAIPPSWATSRGGRSAFRRAARRARSISMSCSRMPASIRRTSR